MKKLAENDIWECWEHSPTFKPINAMWHEKVRMDTRADLMIRMITAWGGPAQLVHAMEQAHSDSSAPQLPHDAQSVVMHAAEVVEAFWHEATRRGWIIEIPPFDKINGA